MRMLFLLLSLAAVPAVVRSKPAAPSIPFDVSSGRPMVPLTVNGKGPYPFVLDTGAPGVMVQQALVDELGLEVRGTAKVTSPLQGTPVEVPLVRLQSIALGDASATGVEATVIDMGGGSLGMGVVGPHVFHERGALLMDFAHDTVTLGAAAPSGIRTWLPFGPSAPLLDVPVEIGELRLDGHIDTGSPGRLAIPSRFEQRLPLSGPARTVGRARTMDAEFEIREAPIEVPARVGDAEIALDAVNLAEMPVANLGTAGLRGLSLYVDWEGKRFALTGAAAAPRASLHTVAAGSGPRFGIRARPRADGSIDVVGTDPGSVAEAIGLLAGDRIVAINGKKTTELAPQRVREELMAQNTEITVERDGKTVVLKRNE